MWLILVLIGVIVGIIIGVVCILLKYELSHDGQLFIIQSDDEPPIIYASLKNETLDYKKNSYVMLQVKTNKNSQK